MRGKILGAGVISADEMSLSLKMLSLIKK